MLGFGILNEWGTLGGVCEVRAQLNVVRVTPGLLVGALIVQLCDLIPGKHSLRPGVQVNTPLSTSWIPPA